MACLRIPLAVPRPPISRSQVSLARSRLHLSCHRGSISCPCLHFPGSVGHFSCSTGHSARSRLHLRRFEVPFPSPSLPTRAQRGVSPAYSHIYFIRVWSCRSACFFLVTIRAVFRKPCPHEVSQPGQGDTGICPAPSGQRVRFPDPDLGASPQAVMLPGLQPLVTGWERNQTKSWYLMVGTISTSPTSDRECLESRPIPSHREALALRIRVVDGARADASKSEVGTARCAVRAA